MFRSTSEPIDQCRQILSMGKLVPFIGAGFSARFNFPTWNGLLDEVAKELDWDPEVFKLSGNHLQLAEYYVVKKGAIGDLRSKLDKLFHAESSQIEKSVSHEMLVALNFSLIYTTNYEDTIERGFEIYRQKYGKEFHVIANIDNFQEVEDMAVQIVKFHGTFTDDSSLVLRN